MRNTTQLLTAAALLALAACAQAQPTANSNSARSTQMAKQFQFTRTERVKVNYLLFLPKGYDAKAEKRWPMMLFLHGAGERGHGHLEGGDARPAQDCRRAPGLPVYPRLAPVPGKPASGPGTSAGAAGRCHRELCRGHEPALPDRPEHGGLRHVGSRPELTRRSSRPSCRFAAAAN